MFSPLNYVLAKKDWDKAAKDLREFDGVGKNLLIDSYGGIIFRNNNGNSALSVYEPYEDHGRVKGVLTPSGVYNGISTYATVNNYAILGETHTTSFMVKPEYDCTMDIVNDPSSRKLCEAGVWTKLVARHVPIRENIVWGFNCRDIPLDAWIEFKEYKVELGTTVTPWIPHISEMADPPSPLLQTLTDTTLKTQQTADSLAKAKSAIIALGGSV